jgi:hypothetical protein
MSNTAGFPVIVGPAGAQPTAPAAILQQLIQLVTATNPGYTANLPTSLIEDVSSTAVAGIVLCDQARVEFINSITPFGANAFTLAQLGEMLGVPIAGETNTSVSVVFTGPPGFVIPVGFTVSDGTYQYSVVDGGVLDSGGITAPLFALATITGSWVVPPNTVVNLVTSVPSSLSPALAVTNPLAGTPSVGAQTEEGYRADVLQANLASSQGTPRLLKTYLRNVGGVQSRLISINQESDGWEIIVGGGDPYQIAYAILTALFDVSTLVGSVLAVTAITKANPGVVTTDLAHGYASGQVIEITGVVGMTAVNGVPFTITVISPTTFSIGVDTSGYATYVSGGVVTPNLRNETVTLNDYPDTYNVTFVVPPQQSLGMVVTWSTTSTNFVSPAAVAQNAVPALVDYINSIVVGQPVNLLQATNAFQEAISGILAPNLLSNLTFAVTINGNAVSPEMGTQLVFGDPESYFFASSATITVIQA